MEIPSGVQISKSRYGHCLIAARNFTKGELIYRNQVKTVPRNTQKYKFTIAGIEYCSDCTNSVEYDNVRCAYTFDGFMNHCCQENTISIKKDDYFDYDQVAIKDIAKG